MKPRWSALTYPAMWRARATYRFPSPFGVYHVARLYYRALPAEPCATYAQSAMHATLLHYATPCVVDCRPRCLTLHASPVPCRSCSTTCITSILWYCNMPRIGLPICAPQPVPRWRPRPPPTCWQTAPWPPRCAPSRSDGTVWQGARLQRRSTQELPPGPPPSRLGRGGRRGMRLVVGRVAARETPWRPRAGAGHGKGRKQSPGTGTYGAIFETRAGAHCGWCNTCGQSEQSSRVQGRAI